MESAWEQAARVKRYIETGPETLTFSDETGRVVLEFAKSSIAKVVLVCPTLHPLGAFAFSTPALRELGLFADTEEPWNVLVTDLRVITEMIDGPAELLHYIDWRLHLPLGATVIAVDELDIYGAYKFGSVGRSIFDGEQRVFMANSTMDFDAYYLGELGDGPLKEKPRRLLGDIVEGHLHDPARERPPRWLERSFALLDLSIPEAASIQTWLESYAPAELAERPWTTFATGDTTVIALRGAVAWENVALDIATSVSRKQRRIIVHIDEPGEVSIWASERRRPS